jgi:prophage antirepressor-like protein
MDILKAFKLLDKTYEITIQGTFENPLFHAKQIGNILEIANIRDSISDFTDDEKVVDLTDTKKGLQKTLFLTEIGLYKLLGKSRKPIANTFQKWMINTIKDIRINGMYKLKEENEVDKKLIVFNSELNTHKNLIKAYDQRNIIYLCRLKYLDDKIIVKIGSSQNIKERISSMNNQFDNIEIILLDIIEINNYRKFEKYLHNNNFIKSCSYPLLKKDSSESKETYLVSDDELKEFIKIINEDKKKYQDIDSKEIEELKLKQNEIELEKIKIKEEAELEKIKLKEEYELKQKELEFEILQYKVNNNIYNNLEKKEIKNEIEFSSDDSEYLSDEELNLTKVNFQLKKRCNGNRSPKVYQYLPDNLSTPIKIFDSPAEVERNLLELDISPAPLRTSAKNNTIYKGFRWLFLNRNLELPLNIPDTVVTKHKSPDIKYIAMIDIKKTKIIQLFSTQKDAVEARNMKSNSFTRAIQQQSISSGHYWNFWDNCSEDMKSEYLKNNKLPEKYIANTGKKVQQIDPKTKTVIKIYNSNRDIVKNFQMSTLTLQKCLKSGEIYNGYIWKTKTD